MLENSSSLFKVFPSELHTVLLHVCACVCVEISISGARTQGYVLILSAEMT